MSHHFHPTRTTHSEVLVGELFRDFRTATDTEALAYQSPKRIATTQRTHPAVRFFQSNRYSSSQEGLKELWSPTTCELINHSRYSSQERERLCSHTLLQKRRTITEKTCGRSRTERSEGSFHKLRRERRGREHWDGA